MDLKQLFTDDDAVSPVIGVILMVAITVILAAVTASFVLGLGDQTQRTTPQASFTFDFEESVSGSDADEGILTITHDGGDTIQGGSLYLRGSGWVDATSGSTSWTTPATGSVDIDDTNEDESWDTAVGGKTEVAAGNSINVGVNDAYNIRVVYEPPEGDTSATLGQDAGPEA
ncbi:type IV pilin N-terminal domain-containing protein [Haloarcula halophila]|uniref:type IV pilin N-terminal domain-containing protein n=1 Tax=Haloarcula TaxID=2237 RepID=UPI0023E36C6A|nr:type IV pilin N-terminal domain-containing protein [Halomicroarcula sp. DFY41]